MVNMANGMEYGHMRLTLKNDDDVAQRGGHTPNW